MIEAGTLEDALNDFDGPAVGVNVGVAVRDQVGDVVGAEVGVVVADAVRDGGILNDTYVLPLLPEYEAATTSR